MIAVKINKTNTGLTEAEINKQIEEAAYYCYLNRRRYAQDGDNLRDWREGENEVRKKQAKGPNPFLGLASILKKIAGK